MLRPFTLAAVLALAACAPPLEDTRTGVGFQDYTLYQQQQAYLARGRAGLTPPPIAASPATPPAPEVGAPLSALGPAAAGPASAPPPQSESERIAADALSAIGASPPPVQPAAAPLPAAAPPAVPSGSNIVAYALATSHPVGQTLYRRTNILGASRFERNCAEYPSDGLAQEAFLSRGGPERDPLGLDPDGDGYACRWDPTPFRNARK